MGAQVVPLDLLAAPKDQGIVIPFDTLPAVQSGVNPKKVVQPVSSPLTMLEKSGKAIKNAFLYLQPQEAGSGMIPPGETPTGEPIQIYAKKAKEAFTTPLVPLDELVPGDQGFLKGATRATSSLTSPASIATIGAIAASGGAAVGAPMAVKAGLDTVNTALSAYFAAQSAEGLVGNMKIAYDAWKAGNIEKAKDALGEGTVQAIIAGTAGKHAWNKVKDIRPGIFVPLRTGPKAQIEAPRAGEAPRAAETPVAGKGTVENPEVLPPEVLVPETALARTTRAAVPGDMVVPPMPALGVEGLAEGKNMASTGVVPPVSVNASEGQTVPLEELQEGKLYYQGVRAGRAGQASSSWWTTNKEEALSFANREGPGGELLVAREGDFPPEAWRRPGDESGTDILTPVEYQKLTAHVDVDPSVYERQALVPTLEAQVDALTPVEYPQPSEGLPDGLLPSTLQADPPENPPQHLELVSGKQDPYVPTEIQPSAPVPPPVAEVTPTTQAQMTQIGTTPEGAALMTTPAFPELRFEVQPNGAWFAMQGPQEEIASGADMESLDDFLENRLPPQEDRGGFPPEDPNYTAIIPFVQNSGGMSIETSAEVPPPLVDATAGASIPQSHPDLDPIQVEADRIVMETARKGGKKGPGDPIGPDAPVPLDSSDEARIQTDLTKFGLISKYFLTLTQWAERNPDIEPLQRYMNHLAEGWEYKNHFTFPADEKIQLWDKLGKVRSDRLSKILLESTKSSWRKKRRLTEDELVNLAKKYKADAVTMQVFHGIDLDFQIAHAQLRDAMEARAKQTIQDPETLKTTLTQIGKDFDFLANRNYFPLSRFGQHVIVVKATKAFEHEGRKFRKGSIVLSEHFEGAFGRGQRQLRYNALKKEFAGKAQVRKDFMDDSSYSLSDFSPVLADLLAKKLGLSPEQAQRMQRLRSELSPANSFTKHALGRKSIAGYSLDAQRAYAAYFQNFAGHMFRLKYADPLERAIGDLGKSASAIKEGDAATRRELASHVKKHYDYTMNPGNDMAALRGWIFNFMFAFSPKQALVNLTQVPMFTYPYLAGTLQKGGFVPGHADAIAVKEIIKAIKDTMGQFKVSNTGSMVKGAALGAAAGGAVGSIIGPVGTIGGALVGGLHGSLRGVSFGKEELKLSPEDSSMILYLTQRGLLNQSFATEVAGVAHGNLLTRLLPAVSMDKTARKFTTLGTLPFKVSEETNRRVTALATYRICRSYLKMTIPEALKATENGLRVTMFEYSRWNRMPIARGKKSAALIFKTFQQNSLYFGLTQPGMLRWWMILAAVGGLSALPFWKDIETFVDGLGTPLLKALGFANPKVDMNKAAHELIKEIGGDPELVMHGSSHSSFGLHKLGAMVGAPIPALDLSPSFQVGTVTPGVAPLLKLFNPKPDVNQIAVEMAQELLGVSGSMGLNMAKSIVDTNPRASNRWAEVIMPSVVRNITKARRYANEGRAINSKGQTLVKFDPQNIEDQVEMLGQLLGATPTKVSEANEKAWAVKPLIDYYTAWREIVLQQYGVAMTSGDREAMADAQKGLLDFQRQAPIPFRIRTVDTLRSTIVREATAKALQNAGLPTQKRMIQLYQETQKVFGSGPAGTAPVEQKRPVPSGAGGQVPLELLNPDAR